MNEFEDFVISCEDEFEVTALRDEDCSGTVPLSLAWPANTSNKKAMIRPQTRRLAFHNARDIRIQNLIEEMIEQGATAWGYDWGSAEPSRVLKIEINMNFKGQNQVRFLRRLKISNCI
jgi:hypothetical protein